MIFVVSFLEIDTFYINNSTSTLSMTQKHNNKVRKSISL